MVVAQMKEQKDIQQVVREAQERYEVESAANASKEEIIGFFRSVSRERNDLHGFQDENDILMRWDWSNLKNPEREDSVFPAWFCRAKKSKEIAGHFGVMPVSLNVKNRVYPAAWGTNMMTLAKWRNTGVASLLFNTAMEGVREKAALFLLAGATNPIAFKIYQRLGFSNLGTIPKYVRVLKCTKVFKRLLKSDLLGGIAAFLCQPLLWIFYVPSWVVRRSSVRDIRMQEISRFDLSFDALWDRVLTLFPIVVKRDSKSLNWRFVDQPHGTYKIFKAEDRESGELKGYVVLREGESHGLRIGMVTDIFASPEDSKTVISLLDFVIRYFEDRKDIDLIQCGILSKPFERILKKTGFRKLPAMFHGEFNFLVRTLNNALDREFVLDRDNWFLNYADSDLDLSGKRS